MPQPKVNVAGADGSLVGVTDGKLDVNLALDAPVTANIGDVEILGHDEVGSFALNVLDSNTVFPDNSCKHVDIMANISNSDIIYIGKTGVVATTGIGLYAGDVYSIDISNTNLLFALAVNSGDDLNVVFYN
jgi:hypothetical protein|tara:strand:+ start:262 stop:654 length:393 start_codon:yes stop_codon:yes gene_type:complete